MNLFCNVKICCFSRGNAAAVTGVMDRSVYRYHHLPRGPSPFPPTPRPPRTLSRPRITQLIHASLTLPPPPPPWSNYPASTSTSFTHSCRPSTTHVTISSSQSTFPTPNTPTWQHLRVFGLSPLSSCPPPCCPTIESLPNASYLNLHYLPHILHPSPLPALHLPCPNYGILALSLQPCPPEIVAPPSPLPATGPCLSSVPMTPTHSHSLIWNIYNDSAAIHLPFSLPLSALHSSTLHTLSC